MHSKVPSENKIKDIFSQFGHVNEVVIKMNPGKNPYVFVEFNDDKGSARARKTLFLDDKLGIKRRELGDASLEIT